jgi:hypothetical protein
MQTLPQADTRDAANQRFLAELAQWFAEAGKPLDLSSLFNEFFIFDGKTLKPGIKLTSDLTTDKNRGLVIWLDVLLIDPAQVTANQPQIMRALDVIMGKIVGPIATPKSQERQEQISLPASPRPAVQPSRPAARLAPRQYSSLAEAIEGELGRTPAEIASNWPAQHKRRKPTPGVLITLATQPETALFEDRGLLRAVFEILAPNLPIANYSPRLQAKLGASAPKT